MLRIEKNLMPAARPDRNNDFEADYQKNELAFVQGGLGHRRMLEYLNNARHQSAGAPESIDAKIKLYEAMSVHYDANLKFGTFHGNIEKAALDKTGEMAMKLSREEVMEQFESYREKRQLIELENKSIAGYIEALNDWKGGPYIAPEDVEELLLDLEYRQAQRIGDDQERNVELDSLRGKYINLTKKIGDAGKRSETIMNLMVKEWARYNGLGHILDIGHGQPQEDKGWGVDLVLSAGKKQNIGLKSHSRDSNVTGFNKELMEKERQKLAGSNVILLDPGHEKILSAFNDLVLKNHRGKMNGLIRPIIKKIFGYETITETKKIADERTAFFRAYGDIPGLKLLELLKEEDLNGLDPSKVNSVNAVIQEKKGELTKAMKDPQEFEKLKEKARMAGERAK